MSTLKSDGIQPTLNTNNLIIRSGADVERLRIQPDGQILVASTTGTTFAGEVNFSNTVRLPGGVQVGGGIGPTRYTALDVVHTNTGLGLPDAVNYNTTRSRSNMMIQASGTNTTLFFGNNSSTHAWLQVQNSDNNPYGLMLNPAGGSVIVGSFAGDTNVMAKAARVSGGGVGHVVPLFTWSSAFSSTSYQVMTQTTPLHAGTWFVYFSGNTDSGIESENFSCVMSHVWTVPASKWLTFATDTVFSGSGTGVLASVASDANSGVWYKIHDSLGTLRTTTVAPGDVTTGNGWTALSHNNSNAYKLPTQDATDTTKIGFVYNSLWYKPVNLMGYAMRIA